MKMGPRRKGYFINKKYLTCDLRNIQQVKLFVYENNSTNEILNALVWRQEGRESEIGNEEKISTDNAT